MKSTVTKTEDPFRLLIGQTLQKWRRLNGNLKQAEVAKRAGIPAHWVGAYERGERPIDSVVIVKICIALGVESDVFLMDMYEAYKRALKAIEGELKNGLPSGEVLPKAAQTQEDLVKSLETVLDLVKRVLLSFASQVAVDSGGKIRT